VYREYIRRMEAKEVLLEATEVLVRADREYKIWGENTFITGNRILELETDLIRFLKEFITEVPSLYKNENIKPYLNGKNKLIQVTPERLPELPTTHQQEFTKEEVQLQQKGLDARVIIGKFQINRNIFNATMTTKLQNTIDCIDELLKLHISNVVYSDRIYVLKQIHNDYTVAFDKVMSSVPDFSAIVLTAEMDLRECHDVADKRLKQIEAYIDSLKASHVVKYVNFESSLKKGFEIFQKRGDNSPITSNHSTNTRGSVKIFGSIAPYVHCTDWIEKLNLCNSIRKKITEINYRCGVFSYAIKHLYVGTKYDVLKKMMFLDTKDADKLVDSPHEVFKKALEKCRRKTKSGKCVTTGKCFLCYEDVTSHDSIVTEERKHEHEDTPRKFSAHSSCMLIKNAREPPEVDHISESEEEVFAQLGSKRDRDAGDEMEVADDEDLRMDAVEREKRNKIDDLEIDDTGRGETNAHVVFAKRLADALSDARAEDRRRNPYPVLVISKGLCQVCHTPVDNRDNQRQRHTDYINKPPKDESDPDQGYIHRSCAVIVPSTITRAAASSINTMPVPASSVFNGRDIMEL